MCRKAATGAMTLPSRSSHPGKPVPHLLVQRLSASKRDKATVPLTTDHWVDTLYGKVKAHIDDFRKQRDELVSRTMPPARLFDHAFNVDERDHIQTGVELNKLYSVTRGKMLHSKTRRAAP